MSTAYAHKTFMFDTPQAHYTAYCHAENRCGGFKHVAALFRNGQNVIDAVQLYVNRTWERYGYETVLRRCARGLMDQREEQLKTRFMRERNYQKMTAKRRAEFEAVTDQDEEMQELRNLYNEIEEYGKPLF